MKYPDLPPVIQAVGLACVPVDHMPPCTALVRKPVAAAVVTLVERNDGHRDAIVSCMSDVRDMELPLPVLINDALTPVAPTIITQHDCEVLALDAASRRFFAEPQLGRLASAEGGIDPVAMFGPGHDEAALCRRLGIPASTASDRDIAKWWNRSAPMATEDAALTVAVSRMMLWAHGASFQHGSPDAFFEALLPLRERLMDLEGERPALKPLVASRPFNRAASFANYYREHRAKRAAGDDQSRWLTFADGQFYV